jgi:microcystin-dependent protein
MSVTQVQTSGITNDSVTTAKINFETALVPVGGIIMWSGSVASIPTGWSLCNGVNGTPNLQNRFIVGAGSGYGVGATGGDATVTLNINQIPSHNHGGSTGGAGGHNHTYTKATHPSGSGPEQNQSGSPEDRTNFNDTGTTSSVGDHQHSISSQGGGQAHENRPPYYALAFIMRLS